MTNAESTLRFEHLGFVFGADTQRLELLVEKLFDIFSFDVASGREHFLHRLSREKKCPFQKVRGNNINISKIHINNVTWLRHLNLNVQRKPWIY
jgi:hypothetical protein